MAIDTMDKVVSALSTAIKRDFYRASATAEGAGNFSSLWKVNGNPAPASSSPPAYTAGSGYVPTSATLGGIPFSNPLSGGTYLLQASISGATVGKLILYDRLWHCSGMTTNAATTLAVTTPGSLTRGDVNGTGVEAFFEIYAAPGATTATWTLNYKDADNADQAGTYTHPANAESVGQMCPILLPNNRGVKQVTSVTFSGTSGTAGDIGVTLLRRVAEFPIEISNAGKLFDFAQLGMPAIQNDACLAFMVLCTATNTGLMFGNIALGQG